MDNKTKILQSAQELFLNGGVQALSVRGIAARAGVSTIGIYSHFQGKQGILDALYVEGFELVSAAMADAQSGRPTREQVRACCERYLEIAERSEAHYRLIFGEHGADYVPSAAGQAVAVEAFRKLTRVVGQLLPEAASAAQKREAAVAVWALLHGYVSLRHQALSGLMDEASSREHALAAVDVLLSGIAELH
ncbi:MAG: TetR/AcrR family transcriptional regulator [Pseudomonadales bacterium]